MYAEQPVEGTESCAGFELAGWANKNGICRSRILVPRSVSAVP